MYKNFIIVYEGIVREYDNALLLKSELEKRGYTVLLAYKSETVLFKNRKAVIVVPNCYSTENYDFYQYILNSNGNPIVSLQYEQVLSKRIEKTNVHNPKGKAKDIWFFCWGNQCFDRLVKQGINRNRIKICGALQLDFLLPEFSSFYLSRQQIADKYNLDINKKWMLYISSFSYVDNSIITNYTAKELADHQFVKDFTEVSVKSQKDTLKWFERLIKNEPDIIIIYRKHPIESDNKYIQELCNKYPNQFKDIDSLSVKQWIKVSDIISTWFSTSIAEVYMAKKPLLLIRPYPIKREYDVPFYYDAKCIDQYEKLILAIHNIASYSIPVSEKILRDYYSIESPAFLRIADELENIASMSSQKKEKTFVYGRIKFWLHNGRIIKLLIKKIYQIIFIYMRVKIKNSKIRKAYSISDWEKSIIHQKDPINTEKYLRLEGIVNEFEK